MYEMSSLTELSRPYAGEYACRSLTLGRRDCLADFSFVRLTLGADGRAVLQLDARDSQSGILYYSWSLDGGMTWSMLMPFANLGSLTFTIEAPLVSGMPVLCRAYNGYDMYSECMAVIP